MIPLTVIGGFLGAGKTTLVNQLLRSGEKRWGVLVNDFGALAIDAALIAARDGDSIALTNGCVCCGLGEDLGAGLAQLAARRPAPEHVIIEASGVSDPRRIAQYALVEPGFSLEPLVVVADAVSLPDQLADRWVADTVRQQLAVAELVVLSKADRAGPGAMTAARAAVTAIQPTAAVLTAAFGAVPAAALSFAGAAGAGDQDDSPAGAAMAGDRDDWPADAAASRGEAQPAASRPPPLSGPLVPAPSGSFPPARRSRLAAEAPHPFRAWLWRPSGPLDRSRLRETLQQLPAAVLRVKGFVALAPEGELHVLQFAAGQWALTPASAAVAAGLVIIGTPDMPEEASLAAGFSRALATG